MRSWPRVPDCRRLPACKRRRHGRRGGRAGARAAKARLMARIPDAFIDELLARTDIVEVIQARVPLKRQGREYSARCPFHDERSPSFTTTADRLEFRDAVAELARQAGREGPREARQRAANPESQGLYEVLDQACRYFQRQLAGSDRARGYLDDRGVGEAVRAQFSVGYAPEGFSALKDALGTDPRQLQLLDRAGLLSKNDRGHVYDKFRDRVMFPIHDRRGRVIAFGGRVLGKDDG